MRQKLLLCIFIFLLLIVGFLHPISSLTQDLGRHIKTGEIIFTTHAIPQTNLFSYTYPDFPFINHHWFSEVIFYVFHQVFGFNGLLILTILVITTTFSLLFFTALKKGHIFAITIVSILYFRVLFERTDVRPEIFSFLFLSLFITILYKNRDGFTRWIFLLPFLELIWVNTHIYFPIGIAVIGLFLVDYLIKNRKQFNPRYTFILVAVLFTCCISTLFNPNGIAGALYPFLVFGNYGYQIEENQTVFFLWNYFGWKTTIFYFFLSSTLLFTSLLLTIKKARLIDWLLAIFFTGLAFNAERNFPLFVFGTFIAISYSLSLIFNTFSRISRASGFAKHIPYLFLFLLLIWQIYQVGSIRKIGFGVESGATKGVDFFLKQNLKGHIFNNFDIGSYLEYRLYPKEKVFVDGRPEAYPASFFQETYIPAQIDPKKFDEIVKKYNIQTIFFSYSDQTTLSQSFLPHISNNLACLMLYLDDYVVIFTKQKKSPYIANSLF